MHYSILKVDVIYREYNIHMHISMTYGTAQWQLDTHMRMNREKRAG